MELAVSDSPMTKDNKNGTVTCLICKNIVKSKAWIAHLNGRKHQTVVANLRQQQNQQQQRNETIVKVNGGSFEAKSCKRPSANNDEKACDSVKKFRVSLESSEDASKPSETETPWRIRPETYKATTNKVIDGVPEGFFEDEKLNSRVAESIEKNASMEKEYANLMKDLHETEEKNKEMEAEEDESSAVERDINSIDEQIDCWRRVSKLEIEYEEVLQKIQKEEDNESSATVSMEVNDDDSDISDDDELNVVMDWRRKRL